VPPRGNWAFLRFYDIGRGCAEPEQRTEQSLSDHIRRAAGAEIWKNGHICHGEGTEPQVDCNWASMTTVAVPAAASRRGQIGHSVLFVWEN